ncbi:hypothetical protein ACQ5TV_05230 [Acetobacter ghanensis]|uniref:hypothetical protein n=1 Tax=Acetobacter ghanensis TaxID=431306 RepID=UPI003D3316A9
MTQSICYADVVRLSRTDSVCVGVHAGQALLCFMVPPAENTRHRADVSLSWCESAQANLPPDVRVRCVVQARQVRAPVVGQLPPSTMQRIHATIMRERTSQTAEGGWPRRSTPHSKSAPHACLQKNIRSQHARTRSVHYA